MKRQLSSILFLILIVLFFPQTATAAQLLIPVGEVIGLELSDDTVIVAAFDDALGSAARDAGLRIGDEIVTIDNQPIDNTEDVRKALNNCDGDVDITIQRGSKSQKLRMEPAQTNEGLRLGIFLRQGIAGIGTVTYYDPDTHRFGTLGHGVSNTKGGLLKMTTGSAYQATVQSVRKGSSGNPGQLKGVADAAQSVGILLKNMPQGVFGSTKQGWRGEPLPVAEFQDVHTGPATIRSTVAGNTVREYSVEILKIYPKDRSDCRNFLIKVTDPNLLNATGGIVQGMGVIDNRDNTKKPGNTGFFNSYPKNDPTIGV